MTRMVTSAPTDYLLVDGLETITLTRNDGTPESIANVARGVLTTTDQTTGQQAGDTTWVMASVEFLGTITKPGAGDIITATDATIWVITSVSWLPLKRVYNCTATAAR